MYFLNVLPFPALPRSELNQILQTHSLLLCQVWVVLASVSFMKFDQENNWDKIYFKH
jgi:hypothetical protein